MTAGAAYNRSNDYRIEFLADYPQHIPVIAGWFFDEWLRDSEGWTIEQAENSVRTNDCFKNKLNVTLISLDSKDNPVGVIQLLDTVRLIGWGHCSPWIDGLYILPQYRNSGIAHALAYRLLAIAESIGFSDIYAAAFEMAPTLKAHHFGVIGTAPYGNRPVTVYKKSLF